MPSPSSASMLSACASLGAAELLADSCPGDASLAAYEAHSLAEGERAAVEAHVARCSSCRALLATLARMSVTYDPASAPGVMDEPGSLAHRPLQAGDIVAGRFRVTALLGRGAMGEVYEAEDAELATVVALKRLRPELAHDDGSLARVRREVRLARCVSHHHVCRVFDLVVHTEGDSPALFVAMERLRGRTLAALLAEEGPLPLPRAEPIALALAQGLGAAHAVGVVHGDLKGQNIMVSDGPGEHVSITDFGLARATGEPAAAPAGSPSYMAPEQLAGGPATIATDVYAFGVVLYELATGRLPARGRTVGELARAKSALPPRPSSLVPGLPRRWDRVVLRCLHPLPSKRYESVAAAARELVPRRRGARRPVALALLVAASLAGAAAVPRIVVARGGEARPTAQELRLAGDARLAALDRAAAVAAYEEALRRDGEDAAARIGLVQALSDRGLVARMQQELEVLRRKAATWSGSTRRRAEALDAFVSQRWEDAARSYREILSREGSVDAAVQLARSLSRAGQCPEALEALAVARPLAQSDADLARLDYAVGVSALCASRASVALPALLRASAWGARHGEHAFRGRTLLAAARVLSEAGRGEEAVGWLEEAHARFLAAGDAAAAAEALNVMAVHDYHQGRLEAAARRWTEAASSARDGDAGAHAALLGNLAAVEVQRGRLAEARERYEQALALARSVDRRGEEALCLHNLALVDHLRGRLDSARREAEEALAFAARAKKTDWEARGRALLALVALDAGAASEAQRAVDDARALAEAHGLRREVHVDVSLAEVEVALGRGRPVVAEAAWSRAASHAGALGEPGAKAAVALAEAEVALARGQSARALRAVEEAETLASRHGLQRDAPRRSLARARIAIAAGALEEARARAEEAAAGFAEQGRFDAEARAHLVLAHVHLALARVHPSGGHADGARAPLARARALAATSESGTLRREVERAAARGLTAPREHTRARTPAPLRGGGAWGDPEPRW